MKKAIAKFKTWSKFKQVLVSILSGIAFLGILLLIVLNVYLTTYETYNPQHLVDEIVQQYISHDLDDIIAMSPEDQQEELKGSLAEVIDEETIFAYQTSSTDSLIEYTVVNNNTKLATIHLEKTGETSLFNIPKVVVKDFVHYPLYTYQIQYPQDCTVTIDGKEISSLGEELKKSENLAAIGLAEDSTYRYELQHFAPIKSIEATSFGADSLVYVSENGLSYEIYHAIPADQQDTIKNIIEGFTKEYAKYTTLRGVGSANVMQYVKGNSSVAKNINAYSNTWGEVVQKDELKEITLTRPIRYNETVFSYDVHAIYQVVTEDGEAKDFPLDFTIYVVSTNGSYAIFDMERAPEDKKMTLVEKKTNDDELDASKDEPTDKEASILNASFKVNEQTASSTISDGNIKTNATFGKGESLTIQADSEIGYLYIKWASKPKTFSISNNSKKETYGKNGYLHELVKVADGQKEITLEDMEGNQISELSIYSPGTLPKDVQDWNTPLEKSDILAFPTHGDDDTLYMGALISEYVALGKNVQLAFLINHNDTLDRPHEILDGMWEMGLRAYPIIGDFPDHYSTALDHASSLYDTDAMMQYLVSTIRRCKPSIVVGHDENGEYGHGVHMLNTYLLKDAITLAGNETYDATSYAQYGGHTPSKTYLHLYPKNTITLDVHKKMEELNGLSPFEKAKAGFSKHTSQHQWDLAVEDFGVGDCRLFGLYHSTVGYDFKTNDLFEGL